jgi:hypothetical protein
MKLHRSCRRRLLLTELFEIRSFAQTLSSGETRHRLPNSSRFEYSPDSVSHNHPRRILGLEGYGIERVEQVAIAANSEKMFATAPASAERVALEGGIAWAMRTARGNSIKRERRRVGTIATQVGAARLCAAHSASGKGTPLSLLEIARSVVL